MDIVTSGQDQAGTGRKYRGGSALIVRGSEEWKAWLKAAAADSRMSISAFLDHASADYARRRGFAEKPPRR